MKGGIVLVMSMLTRVIPVTELVAEQVISGHVQGFDDEVQ